MITFLKRYYHFSLVAKIFAGFVLGIVLGLVLGESSAVLKPFGDVFIKLLKMIVMPIILCTIIVGASSISPSRLGRVGMKVFIFYLATTLFALVIGVTLANLFSLGSGLSLELPDNYNPDVATSSLGQVFMSIIPDNPFLALTGKSPLPVIFFALLFGFALAIMRASKDDKLRSGGDILFAVVDTCAEIMFKITRWILEYAPIGVAAIMAVVVGTKGTTVIGPFIKLILAGYLGMLIHIVFVYGGALTLFRINVIKFIRGIKEAMLMAYSTRSSGATLPVSLACAENNLGISNRISSFSLPLGATMNMDGTAMYLAMETIFAANVFGIDLSFGAQASIVLTALLASIGTAAMPSASLIMLVGVLRSVNVPVSIIPLFAGFDHISDMMRTMTNATGDLTGTLIVAKMENDVDFNTGVWVGKAHLDDLGSHHHKS